MAEAGPAARCQHELVVQLWLSRIVTDPVGLTVANRSKRLYEPTEKAGLLDSVAQMAVYVVQVHWWQQCGCLPVTGLAAGVPSVAIAPAVSATFLVPDKPFDGGQGVGAEAGPTQPAQPRR
jgi:hypothetical protein